MQLVTHSYYCLRIHAIVCILMRYFTQSCHCSLIRPIVHNNVYSFTYHRVCTHAIVHTSIPLFIDSCNSSHNCTIIHTCMPLLLSPCNSSHIHTTVRNLVQSFTQLYNCTHMHTDCTLTQLFTQLYNGQHIHTTVHASRVAAQSEPVMFLCSGVEGMLRQC